MFTEAKESLIEQLITEKEYLKANPDEAYLWQEIVAKVGYTLLENLILAQVLYELQDEVEVYDAQELERLINVINDID